MFSEPQRVEHRSLRARPFADEGELNDRAEVQRLVAGRTSDDITVQEEQCFDHVVIAKEPEPHGVGNADHVSVSASPNPRTDGPDGVDPWVGASVQNARVVGFNPAPIWIVQGRILSAYQDSSQPADKHHHHPVEPVMGYPATGSNRIAAFRKRQPDDLDAS